MLITNVTSGKALETIRKYFSLPSEDIVIVISRLLNKTETSELKKYKIVSILQTSRILETQELPQVLSTDTVVITPGGSEVAYLHLVSGYGAFCPLYYANIVNNSVDLILQTFHKSLPLDFWYIFVISGLGMLIENQHRLEDFSNKILKQELDKVIQKSEEALSKIVKIYNTEVRNMLDSVFSKKS